MMKFKDLKDYFNEIYIDEIFSACDAFFKKNKDSFALYTREIPYPSESYLDDALITSLYSEDIEKKYITIKATVRLDIIIRGMSNNGRNSDVVDDTIYHYVELIIKTRFVTNFEDFQIYEINNIDDKTKYKSLGSSTKEFVPYMKEKDLDVYAENFLFNIYPNALKKPIELPVEEVVKKLGLSTEYTDLEEDVFGKIFFLDENKGKYKSKTILIDKKKSYINGVGSVKNTIIHECIHWYFHRKFFALQHLLDPSLSSITCTNIESDSHYNDKYSSDLRWIEWQANTLAPRILMPATTTRIKFEELYDWYRLEYQNNLVQIYQKILLEISDFFGVSKQLAKIRLIQLGYNQYIGIDEYIDNGKFSYIIKNESLQPGDTYRISFIDFLMITYNNKFIKEAIENQRIIYVNGFLIINNNKYVKKVNGTYSITDYALNAIDECCIKFKIMHATSKSMDKMYSMFYLCRSNKNLPENVSCELSDSETNNTIINNAYSYFLEDDKEDDEIIKNLNCSFNEAFRYLYDYYDMPSDNYCAKLCGLDHKTITGYYLGNSTEPHYKKVLAICAGFRLRPRVSLKLLQTIRINLSESPLPQDHLYYMLIFNNHLYGLENWNKCIKEAKIGDEHLLP